MKVLVGILVGGRGTRMGGVPKGLLRTQDQRTIIDRLVAVLGYAVGENAKVCLVGDAAAYRHLALATLKDEPQGIGPLGGLRALLHAAQAAGCASALAIACDMPYVEAPLIRSLLAHAPEAHAVAPKLEGKWQPLFARYAPTPTLLAIERVLQSPERGLYRVLGELGPNAQELPLTAAQTAQLYDWDMPSDIH